MEVLVVQETKMIKYITLTLGLLVASFATAQEQANSIRLPCGSFQEAGSILQATGQDGLWKGRGSLFNTTGERQTPEVVFHVNQDTGAWSLVALYPDQTACLVMAGWDFEPWTHSTTKKNNEIEQKSP